jgi:hypothetical protein
MMPVPQSHSSDALDTLAIPEIEQPFVGRWNQLVSTTNWEKGRIIHEWREALVQAGAPTADYADESWSRRVGGVTSQHVGRLRRVYHRFGNAFASYQGLYWSHFQAAVDWDDAEMWLEGAVQNHWSVSEMRGKRGETLGDLAADQANQDDDASMAGEVDEDFEASADSNSPSTLVDEDSPLTDNAAESVEEADGDHGQPGEASAIDKDSDPDDPIQRVETAPFRPFEKLGDLPPDLADAMDAFKLAILRHKTDGWQQIDCASVLGILDALKELALAPSGEPAPF